MNSQERVNRVTEHMCKAIDYVRHEYDVNYAEMIGVLQIIQMDLYELGRDADDSST